MLGNALVVVKVELSSLLPADWTLDGSAILEDLSWECLFIVKKFLLESNLNPILFCLSLRKMEGKEQFSLMRDSETLNSLLSLGQTLPVFEGCLFAFPAFGRTVPAFPVGKTRRKVAASLGWCEN